MTIVQQQDNRNAEWRASNIGSKMLEKMGWKEGDGIGKRNINTTALKAVKRQEGLGIGAKRQTEGGPSASTGTFAAVLANLQAQHGGGGSSSKPSSSKDKKREAKRKAKKAAGKKSKKSLSLPANKVLAGHARKMRAAKFGAKSAEDLACIFGNTEVVQTALGGASTTITTAATTATARPAIASFGNNDNNDNTKKRSGSAKKKSKKDNGESSSSSPSSEAEAEAEKKPKKEKKEKKSKKEKKRKKSKSD